MKKFSNAFTLAEVLITLGIIGVVAAMTMPTLMNQTNGAQYKAAYKKALSALAQAITLNVALDDISFADVDAGTAGLAHEDGKNTVASILNTRMNVVKTSTAANSGYGTTGEGDEAVSNFPGRVESETCEGEGEARQCTPEQVTPDTFLFFNDGTMFAFKAADATKCKEDASECSGVIDVNGTKGPNRVVTCSAGEGDTCVVDSPTDIYPVVFYDQTILPASDAAKAVLFGK